MVPIPKPLSSERHFRSKKRVLENSPSQSCMGTMHLAAALRRISAIMLL